MQGFNQKQISLHNFLLPYYNINQKDIQYNPLTKIQMQFKKQYILEIQLKAIQKELYQI